MPAKVKPIFNPVLNGAVPFSLSQKKSYEIMCSGCRALFDRLSDFQYHRIVEHPEPKKEKIKNYKPRKEETTRPPNAKERKEIREAINAGRIRRSNAT